MHTEEDMQYIQGISWQTVFFQTHAKVSKMTLSFAVDTLILKLKVVKR